MLFVFCLMDNKFLLWMLVKTESNSTHFPLAKHLATTAVLFASTLFAFFYIRKDIHMYINSTICKISASYPLYVAQCSCLVQWWNYLSSPVCVHIQSVSEWRHIISLLPLLRASAARSRVVFIDEVRGRPKENVSSTVSSHSCSRVALVAVLTP